MTADSLAAARLTVARKYGLVQPNNVSVHTGGHYSLSRWVHPIRALSAPYKFNINFQSP